MTSPFCWNFVTQVRTWLCCLAIRGKFFSVNSFRFCFLNRWKKLYFFTLSFNQQDVLTGGARGCWSGRRPTAAPCSWMILCDFLSCGQWSGCKREGDYDNEYLTDFTPYLANHLLYHVLKVSGFIWCEKISRRILHAEKRAFPMVHLKLHYNTTIFPHAIFFLCYAPKR